MPTRKPAAVRASLLLFLACSSSVVRAAESLEVAPTWVAGGDHAPLTGLNAADQLVNWQLTAVLMSDGVSRSAGLGWFDPRLMESDYQHLHRDRQAFRREDRLHQPVPRSVDQDDRGEGALTATRP